MDIKFMKHIICSCHASDIIARTRKRFQSGVEAYNLLRCCLNPTTDCSCCVHDIYSIKNFRRGFIWDRFTNQLPCALPSPSVMHRILLDKISKIPEGNPSWSIHAMEMAAKLGVRSPRKIIGFLAGRHRLETGEYQADIYSIMRASTDTNSSGT